MTGQVPRQPTERSSEEKREGQKDEPRPPFDSVTGHIRLLAACLADGGHRERHTFELLDLSMEGRL